MEISYYFFGPSADSTILYLVIDDLVPSNLKYITLHIFFSTRDPALLIHGEKRQSGILLRT